MRDIADLRGIRDEGQVFTLAKRCLLGDIKAKFDQRYRGPRTLTGLQNFIFREISPRDPVGYYQRRFMSCVRKPGQRVESFQNEFLNIKRALEMAMGLESLPETMALSAYRNALCGGVGTNLEKL